MSDNTLFQENRLEDIQRVKREAAKAKETEQKLLREENKKHADTLEREREEALHKLQKAMSNEFHKHEAEAKEQAEI